MRHLSSSGTLLVVSLVFCASAVAQDQGATASSYDATVLEKIAEVAEIRFKELADLGTSGDEAAGALLRLGKYRFFQEDFAGSEYYLRKLVEGFVGSDLAGEARLWLGRTYLARIEIRSALVELQGGLEEERSRRVKDDDLIGRYLFWIGEVYLRDDKTSDASGYFETLSDSHAGHPLSTVALRKLRQIYQNKGMSQAVEKVDRKLKESEFGEPPAKDRKADGKTRQREEYLVQLASFSSNANARNMVKALEADGFKAQVREIKIAKGTRYRVVIGGFDSREKAEETARKVEKKGYDSSIVKEWKQ